MTDVKNKFGKIVERALDFYAASLNLTSQSDILPTHISIEPTNACNLRCIHCHHSMRGKGFDRKLGVMEWDTYAKVIDEVREYATYITLNLQGEPTLNKHVLQMVQYAKEAGLSVSLLTNATRLNRELATSLVEAELDRIVFSFEGSTKEVHEKVRRNSCYEQTLFNILNFLKINEENGHPTFVCMSMVESPLTMDDVPNYKKMFEQLPVNTIFVNPLLNLAGISPLADVESQNKTRQLEKSEIPICRMAWEVMPISWNGDVLACPVDVNEAHVVGNILEDSYANIWNSQKMQKFRQCHIDREYDWIEEQGPLCANCDCKFMNEYDMRDLRSYVTQQVVRQAKIYGNKLATADVFIDDSAERAKLENLDNLLARFQSDLER